MRKIKLMLDLDGVIFNIQEYLEPKLHLLAYNKGIDIVCNNWNYNLKEYLGKELRQLFFSELYEDYLLNGSLFPYAKNYIDLLYKKCEIHLVTNRGVQSEATAIEDKKVEIIHRDLTMQALKKNKIAYDTIEFTNDKIGYLNSNNIDIAVDDYIEYLIRIKYETSTIPICFSQAHNIKAADYGIKIVYTWPQLTQVIERLIGEINDRT